MANLSSFDRQKILEQFASIASLSIAEATGFLPLVELAVSEVERMLKNDVTASEHQPLLNHLCSAICCYKYVLSCSLNEPISIKNLSVSLATEQDSKLKNAVRIKNDAIISARHLLRDDDFFFGRVI